MSLTLFLLTTLTSVLSFQGLKPLSTTNLSFMTMILLFESCFIKKISFVIFCNKSFSNNIILLQFIMFWCLMVICASSLFYNYSSMMTFYWWHILYNHSPIERHLRFQFLTITSKASIILCKGDCININFYFLKMNVQECDWWFV